MVLVAEQCCSITWLDVISNHHHFVSLTEFALLIAYHLIPFNCRKLFYFYLD